MILVGDVLDHVKGVGEVEDWVAIWGTEESETWESTKRGLFVLDVKWVFYCWSISTGFWFTSF